MVGRPVWVTLGVVVAVLCFGAGLLIGMFLLGRELPGMGSKSSASCGPSTPTASHGSPPSRESQTLQLVEKLLRDADPSISDRLINSISTDNIEQHLRYESLTELFVFLLQHARWGKVGEREFGVVQPLSCVARDGM